MTDETEINLEAQIQREGDALSKLNDIITEFNGEGFTDMHLIEEALLIYLVTRMSASANAENGEEYFPRKDILSITNAGIQMGKDVVAQGRKDGSLPTPFKLIKPGMH